MMLKRILTAVFLIPFVVAILWFGSLPFFIFVTSVSLLCLWEYSLMAEDGGYPNQLILSLAGGFLLLLAFYIDGAPFGPLHKAPSPTFIFLLWVFAVFLREFVRSDMTHSYLRIITTVSGVVLCALFLGHLILIRELRMVAGEGFQWVGRPLIFFLFLIVWATDTFSWVVGNWIGRWRMAPVLSPKKTWEGAAGGILAATLVGWLFREAFLKVELTRAEAVFYAVTIAVTAQISDLSESLLKRSFGVKDSSQLLPGHGGMLDRFDSFLFAAPFFYYLLIATGRFQ